MLAPPSVIVVVDAGGWVGEDDVAVVVDVPFVFVLEMSAKIMSVPIST